MQKHFSAVLGSLSFNRTMGSGRLLLGGSQSNFPWTPSPVESPQGTGSVPIFMTLACFNRYFINRTIGNNKANGADVTAAKTCHSASMKPFDIEKMEGVERKVRPDKVLGHLPPDQKERIILWLGTLSYQDTLAKIQAPPPKDLLNSAILSASCAQTKPSLPDSDDKLTRSKYI